MRMTLALPFLLALACTAEAQVDDEPTCADEVHDCQELVTGECDSANFNRYRECLVCDEAKDACECVLQDEDGAEVERSDDEDCLRTILSYCEYES